MRRYQFGFILSTALGNANRYRILRKYVERDPEVVSTWAPVRHFYEPDERDPVRLVPFPFRKRAIALSQSWPVLGRLSDFDAVMIHQFEAQPGAILLRRGRPSPVLFAAQDNPPAIDPEEFPVYPEGGGPRTLRKRLRLAAESWTARHTSEHLCWSAWQARGLIGCGVPADRCHVIHTGLDLDEWPVPDFDPRAAGDKPRVLFVGGDFERKGGSMLLGIFRDRFVGQATLDIVTSEPIDDLPPGVSCYTGLSPGDMRLRALFSAADIFVLPTLADLSPWVCLEAMAAGKPVISTRVGGIADMVADGVSGLLVPPSDPAAFADSLAVLLADADLCRRMGRAGRDIIESTYDASRNVARMLELMKARTVRDISRTG